MFAIIHNAIRDGEQVQILGISVADYVKPYKDISGKLTLRGTNYLEHIMRKNEVHKMSTELTKDFRYRTTCRPVNIRYLEGYLGTHGSELHEVRRTQLVFGRKVSDTFWNDAYGFRE